MIKPTNCASSETSEQKDGATAQSDHDSVSVWMHSYCAPRCVIWSAYTYFCCLDSVVPAITKNEPKDVDEQSGLTFTWSEAPKSSFLLRELKTAVPLYSLCESDIIV